MDSLSRYSRCRLARAYSCYFPELVTAFLTNVIIVSCSGYGVMYRHVKASRVGYFQDGHRLRTSDILHAGRYGSFWALRTVSGSFYVIASFHRKGGRQSLQTFLRLRSKGIHLTPERLQ